MSSKKIVDVKKRMKETQITEKHIAQYIMRPVQEVSAWLQGNKKLPYSVEWKIYDFLEVS